MNERYNREIDVLQMRLKTTEISHQKVEKQAIEEQIIDILNGLTNSEAFYKNLLDRMVVYKDGRIEVHLNDLPQRWIFQRSVSKKDSGPV